jgi:hypothetical protein
MSSNYVVQAVLNTDLINNSSFSRRSDPINYNTILQNAITLLGQDLAIMWGIASNLEGLKPKISKFVIVRGVKYYSEDVLNIINGQRGHVDYSTADGSAHAREMDKELVTISRLARATAFHTIEYLKKKSSYKLETNLEIDGLNREYQFLNSIYGMSDDVLYRNQKALNLMYTKWDAQIAEATDSRNGWNIPKSGERRVYVDQFLDFLSFRKIDQMK